MNALELLRNGHRRLQDLLERHALLDDDAWVRRIAIAEQIRRELAQHAEMEQHVFHPALRAALGTEAGAAVRRAEEELRAAREALSVPPSRPPARERMERLSRSLGNHLEHEECGVFPAAKALGPYRLEDLGLQMESVKTWVDAAVEPAQEIGGSDHDRDR